MSLGRCSKRVHLQVRVEYLALALFVGSVPQVTQHLPCVPNSVMLCTGMDQQLKVLSAALPLRLKKQLFTCDRKVLLLNPDV